MGYRPLVQRDCLPTRISGMAMVAVVMSRVSMRAGSEDVCFRVSPRGAALRSESLDD